MFTTPVRTPVALIFLAAALALTAGAPAQSTPVDPNAQAAQKHWDEMMHYIAIGRWDLAEGHGDALLAGEPDPQQLLMLAESKRYANSYNNLALLRADSPIKQIADDVLKLVERGRFLRRTDRQTIAADVKRLSETTRARMLAVKRLTDSGEWAVPLMIEALRDPDRGDELLNIKWALPQLGKNAVNPLMAVLQHYDDLKIRLIVLNALGEIGYRGALPVIRELADIPESSSELKVAAHAAIRAIDPDESDKLTPAALLYQQLAENYYNDIASLEVPANQELANVWFWDKRMGLYREEVPRAAFDELMTMRYCEEAVRLDPSLTSAISLWLSAFFRLETTGHPQPEYFGLHHADAGTYALTAGPQYLHQALARALDNSNRPVALAAIQTLQRNSGQHSLLYEIKSQQPLLRALTFPDREVRFSAALTIAGALPHKPFAESDLVMSILTECLRQRGDYCALVVDPDLERRGLLAVELRDNGFSDVVAGENFYVTLQQAERLPGINLIAFGRDVPLSDVRKALDTIAEDYRLAFCPTVIITDPPSMPNVKPLKQDHPFLEVVLQGTTTEDLAELAVTVLERNHATPFAPDKADAYATAAARVIEQLAITESEVLNVRIAEETLLAAAYEPRTPIQVAAIGTLARIDTIEAQRRLAKLGLDEDVDLATRLLALRGVSFSAKAFGNLLLGDHISAIYDIVASREQDILLRNGAAEAYGALNLPSAKVAELITTHKPSALH